MVMFWTALLGAGFLVIVMGTGFKRPTVSLAGAAMQLIGALALLLLR